MLNKNVKQKCTCSRGSKKLQAFDGAQLYLIFQPLYCTLKRLVDTEKVVSEKSKGLPPEIFTASTTTDIIFPHQLNGTKIQIFANI